MANTREKEIKAKLDSNIKDRMTRRVFPWYQGMALKGTAGTVAGYAAGLFCKQVTEILIFWSGLAAASLGFL